MASVLVVLPHELVDLALELGNRIERAASDGLLRDHPEPPFDLVEPRAVGRCEVQVETRAAREPSLDLGVLTGAVVVADQMHIEFRRHIRFDVPQEGQEHLVPVFGFALGRHRTVGDVERHKQGSDAVPDMIISDALDVAEPMGNTGCVRSRACTLLFSSTHSTSAWSGGFRYSPTMSRTCSMKNGSFDSLKLLLRWGCKPNRVRYRCTVLLDSPVSAAKPRRDQWVLPLGFFYSAVSTSCAIASSLVLRGRPDFQALCSPVIPSSANRRRHREMVGRLTL